MPPARASASQSTSVRPLAGSSWPVTTVKCVDSAAVGDRDAGVGGRADGAGDAGHDLERDAGRGERLGLLAAAAEHERVAALQPHDASRPVRPALDEQRVDLVLGEVDLARAPCPPTMQLGAGGREVEQRRRRQPVVHDDVGARRAARRRAR